MTLLLGWAERTELNCINGIIVWIGTGIKVMLYSLYYTYESTIIMYLLDVQEQSQALN